MRCCIILINYIVVPVSEVAFSRDYAFALFDVLACFVLFCCLMGAGGSIGIQVLYCRLPITLVLCKIFTS